jgi:hypothetical protein
MNYGEGRSIAELISSVITVLVYGTLVVLGIVFEWFVIGDILQFWAIVILIFIPFSVVVRIVVSIVYSVGNTVAHEIKGEFPEGDEIVDERDRLIMLKATRNSMFLFVVGFLVGLIFLAFQLSPHYFFGSIVLFGILTDFAQTALTIIYYRKGV